MRIIVETNLAEWT